MSSMIASDTPTGALNSLLDCPKLDQYSKPLYAQLIIYQMWATAERGTALGEGALWKQKNAKNDS